MSKTIHLSNPWRRSFYWSTYCGIYFNATSCQDEKWYAASTQKAGQVTCKNCLASLVKMDREYPESAEARMKRESSQPQREIDFYRRY